MQILFFFNGDFNEGNGANARLKAYGKGLIELGSIPLFLVIRPTEFGDSGINKESKGIIDGLNFQYLTGRTKRGANFLLRIAFLLVAWFNAVRVLANTSRSDTVLYFYGAQFITHLPILVFAKLIGFKSIIELTELHSLKIESTTLKTFLARLNNGFIEWTLPFWFHECLVTTRRLKLFYSLRFARLHPAIIPVVCDSSRFSDFQSQAQTFKIGYLGSFAPKDGVEGIIEAFSIALVKFPNLKLRLIGFQTGSFSIKRELERNNLDLNRDSVEVTGQVAFSDIPKLLSQCDLLLMNRTSDGFANYGFPIKLAEYLATGRPCICTNVSDISHYFVSGVHCQIIEADNVDSLGKKILDRYENYGTYSEMGLEGKKRGDELFNHLKSASFIKNKAEKLLEK